MPHIGTISFYRCDAPGCRKRGRGHTHELPEGWKCIAWKPGILRPPGFVPPPPGFACSETCGEVIKEQIEQYLKTHLPERFRDDREEPEHR
jgi:hypothetical protein